MCRRLEAAFIQLWHEAGLGPLPTPAASTPRGGQRQQHGQKGQRSGGPSRQQSLEQLIHHGPPAALPPPQPPKRQRTGGPSPGATSAGGAATLAAVHHLTQQQQQQVGEEELAELAEEERALERLLSTADGNLGEDLGAATDGEPSPLLWDVPSAAGLGISGGGSAAAAKPDMPSAPGVAARMAVNPYSPGQWHAPAQSPFESNQASAALLHPGRGAADSLPPVAVMMPQPQQQPQLPDGHSQALPGLLSGLVAATAAVTPEQLQREQRVLGAWHLLQQQRLAAARASEAADQAVAELARARLVGTAAASALGRATMRLFCVWASWFAAQLVPPADCPSTFTACLPARPPARPPACLPACPPAGAERCPGCRRG